MPKKLDQILVIDLEATCWEGPPPAGQISEIIEIGVCVLHIPSGELGKSISYLIRPERSSVSAFCTELTTLTEHQLQKYGMAFPEACRRIEEKLGGRSRAVASWGDYDRDMMQRQCAGYEITYPFSGTHINVSALYALQRGQKRQSGLAKAMAALGMPFEGTHHRGVDDATNTAKILSHIMGLKTAAETAGVANNPLAKLAQYDPAGLAKLRASSQIVQDLMASDDAETDL